MFIRKHHSHFSSWPDSPPFSSDLSIKSEYQGLLRSPMRSPKWCPLPSPKPQNRDTRVFTKPKIGDAFPLQIVHIVQIARSSQSALRDKPQHL